MKAIVYSEAGGPNVLRLTDLPVERPGRDEVRVRVAVSGLNPTDSRFRLVGGPQNCSINAMRIPHQDGAGVIDALGPGVEHFQVGQPVWIYEAAWNSTRGTAQEYVNVSVDKVAALPDGSAFDLGACLGVPAVTAHLALTSGTDIPSPLRAGALTGRTVLVTDVGQAVGHFAIQLARWAGATVIGATGDRNQEAMATASGADAVINRGADTDMEVQLRQLAPEGVDIVVEVAPATSPFIRPETLAPGATVAIFADDGGTEISSINVRSALMKNIQVQFLWTFTCSPVRKRAAVEGICGALLEGALSVGEEFGLPLHRLPLSDTAEAHRILDSGIGGKVIVDVPLL